MARPPVRIGLDARAADARPTGLTTYARQLVTALTRLDTPYHFVVFRRPDAGPPFATGANVEERHYARDASSPTLARSLPTGDIDLFHSLHHFLPLAVRTPRTVVTLHDLIWVEHPELIHGGRFGRLAQAVTHVYARHAVGYALRRADRVIAISRYTAARATARYGVPPGKLSVVYHGVDHDRFSVLAGLGEPSGENDSRFFLCVGNTRPYKNIRVALEAFALCAPKLAGVRLTITGRTDALGELQALARALGIEAHVTFTGSVPDTQLLALFHGALALVMPSLVEGFGLPVLEAMASGCPVIGSVGTTVDEIAGGAGLLADPRLPASFAEAMERVALDVALRDDLSARGVTRAAEFQWARCAEETLQVYRALL